MRFTLIEQWPDFTVGGVFFWREVFVPFEFTGCVRQAGSGGQYVDIAVAIEISAGDGGNAIGLRGDYVMGERRRRATHVFQPEDPIGNESTPITRDDVQVAVAIDVCRDRVEGTIGGGRGSVERKLGWIGPVVLEPAHASSGSQDQIKVAISVQVSHVINSRGQGVWHDGVFRERR